MAKVPKYVEALLRRRTILAGKLADVCNKIDTYCEKIGVDFDDPEVVLLTDIRIYCETDAGYISTLRVIERTLEKKEAGA